MNYRRWTWAAEKMWLWNVMDSETRYILASHLDAQAGRQRSSGGAEKGDALAAEKPPETIVTDKLKSYTPAVKDVLPETRHMQSEGITADLNNNLSGEIARNFPGPHQDPPGPGQPEDRATLPRRLGAAIQPVPGP